MRVPFLRSVLVASPSAGAEFAMVAPGDAYWRLLSLRFILTTDANVANRGVTLTSGDGTSLWWQVGYPEDHTAGIARTYATTTGAVRVGTGGLFRPIGFPAEGVWLYPGWDVRSSCVNIQVGDQYSDVVALVEEFDSGPGADLPPVIPGRGMMEGW